MAAAAMVAETAAMATEERTSMDGFRHEGGCHCGAVRWTLETAHRLEEFTPRACDCDFCTRHRAAWVSDAAGSLQVRDPGGQLRRYRQGSGQADFLICGDCGVLVGVTCVDNDGLLRGAVNRNSFDERHLLGAEVVASPQQLAPAAKLARWSQLWTPAALP
jgi:hypothetical protein